MTYFDVKKINGKKLKCYCATCGKEIKYGSEFAVSTTKTDFV